MIQLKHFACSEKKKSTHVRYDLMFWTYWSQWKQREEELEILFLRPLNLI